MAAIVLLRARSLARQAADLRAMARDLRAHASSTRRALARSVLQSPTRRLTTLARGGSDGPPASDEVLRETRDPRCPHCSCVEALEPSGAVQASDGLIKSTYRCGMCARFFLYVRKPFALMWSIGESEAPSEV